MLDKNFIIRKVKLIQEDLAKLEPLSRISFDELVKDDVIYAATERVLERMITRAIDINRHIIGELATGLEKMRTYQDTFLVLAELGVYPQDFGKNIAPSAALRNILVHEYDSTDVRLIYESVKQALAEYTQYCGYLIKFLENR